MELWQSIVTIAVVAVGTMLTRFLPFVLFPEHKPTPKVITYLGTILPYAMTGLLIVYSLHTTQVVQWPYGIPELIGVLVVAGMHMWRRNMMLSMASGTIVYMILVQTVFA